VIFVQGREEKKQAFELENSFMGHQRTYSKGGFTWHGLERISESLVDLKNDHLTEQKICSFV
jgi:hypothetical protein